MEVLRNTQLYGSGCYCTDLDKNTLTRGENHPVLRKEGALGSLVATTIFSAPIRNGCFFVEAKVGMFCEVWSFFLGGLGGISWSVSDKNLMGDAKSN